MERSPRVDFVPPDEARAWLRAACGSSRWVERMMVRRPFGSVASLLDAARDEWFALGDTDWREAFAQHPKIGDRAALAARFPATHQLSSQEQAGVGGAAPGVLDELAEKNRLYEEKFGYIFIVCATGKSAEEMLALLGRRLGNEPGQELRTAAEEQAKITAIRLQKM
jgi:2-oxo-4-hydroxy-4-carboxy-5-ureidoimidazoline decarboxylase